jgi:hypothetical protein
MATSWKGTIGAMLVGGVVGVFLAPIVTPAIARAARPTARAIAKAGMAIYQRGQQAVAELRETVEDVAAEINAEQHVETPAQAGAARTGPPASVH